MRVETSSPKSALSEAPQFSTVSSGAPSLPPPTLTPFSLSGPRQAATRQLLNGPESVQNGDVQRRAIPDSFILALRAPASLASNIVDDIPGVSAGRPLGTMDTGRGPLTLVEIRYSGSLSQLQGALVDAPTTLWAAPNYEYRGDIREGIPLRQLTAGDPLRTMQQHLETVRAMDAWADHHR